MGGLLILILLFIIEKQSDYRNNSLNVESTQKTILATFDLGSKDSQRHKCIEIFAFIQLSSFKDPVKT